VVEAVPDRAAFEEAARKARRRVEEEARRQAERSAAKREREQGSEEEPAVAVVVPGTEVRIAATGARGVVIEVRDGRATVDANGLRLDLKVTDLEPLEPGSTGRRADRTSAKAGARPGPDAGLGGGWRGPSFEASPEVHLLGLRAEEVAGRLQPALDAAVQAGLPSLRIVHGKGTGVLREVVAELLDEDPRVVAYRPGRVGEGGGGVTVAELG
jgi:DNA mismatch repair protein MutS2